MVAGRNVGEVEDEGTEGSGGRCTDPGLQARSTFPSPTTYTPLSPYTTITYPAPTGRDGNGGDDWASVSEGWNKVKARV